MPNSVTYEIPVITYSEANRAEHWAKRASRVKAQRIEAWRQTILLRDQWPPPPYRISLHRQADKSHQLDTDNLARALKAVRDGIADALRINDGDPAHEWTYQQGAGPEYAVYVMIETRTNPGEQT